MSLVNLVNGEKPVHLVLAKDRVRTVKRGHPWLFSESLKDLPRAPAGSLAVLKTPDGDILAKGYYDPNSKISFRAFALGGKERLDDALVQQRLSRALQLRQLMFDTSVTNGFRLVNGEGDGLPGLVVDVYDKSAVMKLDGAGAEAFYNSDSLAQWLMAKMQLRTVFLKYKSGQSERGRLLAGALPDKPVRFVENGINFQADLIQGQKSGFFLDQRNNRALVRRCARSARVLNLFAYTGGFSVYAGMGGAKEVTSVDVAEAAMGFASANWAELNGLDPGRHHAVVEDAFAFLERATKARETWDLVVCDPPAFAPNKAAVENAKEAYKKLFAAAARVTRKDGLLALASCSSHIPAAMFGEICEEAVSRARRQGCVLGVYGQPEDHPFPIAAEELRYLKFILYRLDG